MPERNACPEPFRKNYNYLNTLIESWYGRVTGGDDLCVAIARKAPRLMEWWEKHEGLSTQASRGVVTEHAIPFTDWSSVGKAIVCDEAIYHGTTFKDVHSVVRELCSDITGAPMVVSEEARSYASIRNIIEDSTVVIPDGAIPFFIDTITSRFLELGKPYDIEYPLIYVPFSAPIDAEKMRAIACALDARLRDSDSSKEPERVYTTETYSRERGVMFSSVSYVMGGEHLVSEGGATADFAKLRFFADGERLCIAVMSPRTINTEDLHRDSPLFSGALLDMWRLIFDAAHRGDGCSEGYCLRREHSLVVMANYLLSFSTLLTISKALRSVITEAGGGALSLNERDLTYLCGTALASRLFSVLSFDMAPSESRPTSLAERQRLSAIPVSYSDAYAHQMGRDVIGGGTSVGDLISGQYSAMHWHVEIRSRAERGDDSGRLNFGESYASMFGRYRLYSDEYAMAGDDGLLLRIHRNIDSRIDNGSVVPGYVTRCTPTMCYWQRMFRSGENEDLVRDQFLRILTFIHRAYCREAGVGHVMRLEMELILALLVHGDGRGVNSIFGYPISMPFPAEGEDYVCRREVEGHMGAIIAAAEAYRLFDIDKSGVITLRPAVAARYTGGTPLSEAEEDAVEVVVKAVCHYVNHRGHDNIYVRNILNSLAYDGDALEGRVVSLRAALFAKINRGEEADVSDFTKRFEAVFGCFPQMADSADEAVPAGSVVRCIAAAEAHGVADVKRRGLDATASRLFVIFNLWSHYCGGGYSPRLNVKAMPTAYKSFAGRAFADGTSAEAWFREEGSADRISSCSRDIVISRLSEAVNI